MLDDALYKYRISAKDTYIVGDSKVDVMAGKSLGIKTIFVLSGKATEDEMKKWEVKPDYIFPGLLGAVEWLLNKEKRKSERAFKRKSSPRDKREAAIEE